MQYVATAPEATLAREFIQSWDRMMVQLDSEPLKYIPPLIDAIADLGEQTPRSVRAILMDFIPEYGEDTITKIINLHYHIDERLYDEDLPLK